MHHSVRYIEAKQAVLAAAGGRSDEEVQKAFREADERHPGEDAETWRCRRGYWAALGVIQDILDELGLKIARRQEQPLELPAPTVPRNKLN